MRKSYKFKKRVTPQKRFNYNHQIRALEVQVIDELGGQLGVLETKKALEMAQERGFDLVEVSPVAKPPVTKFMDYGSFKYQKEKQLKKQKSQSKSKDVKSIRMSMKIGEHDKDTKLKQANNFLNKGHKIKVVSKDKEISLQLLQAFNIPYINLGKTKKGLFWKFIHTSRAILKTFMVSLRFKPDVYLGRASAELAFSSFILRKPYLCFSDTEHAKINRIVAHPFATKIITPSCFKINFGKKHLKVDSYFELAYLHPQYFKPDPSVFEDLDSGLKKGDEFFVLRFVSWGASHDIGQHGFIINNKY